MNQEELLKKFAQGLAELVASASLEDGLYKQSVILEKKGDAMDILSFDLVEAKQDGDVRDGSEDGAQTRGVIVQP